MKGGVSEETIWAIMEAYLFEVKNTVPLKNFVELFKGAFTEEELEDSLRRMEKSRWEENRGVILICRRGMWSLEALTIHTTVKTDELKLEEASDLQDEWSEGEKTVLAIIAYEGPVSESRVDEIMGTDCGHYVISLQERGMVKRKGSKFVVTPCFFGFFGLKDSSELFALEEKTLMQCNPSKEIIKFSDFNDTLIEDKNVCFDYRWPRKN